MSRVAILMYHGLVRDPAALRDIDPAERPYTLLLDEFEGQLDALVRAGVPVLDPEVLHGCLPAGGGVVLTFDDGHASNAELALPALLARGQRACFFITTGFVGQRAGYCSWQQVRDLAAQGMRIGAHGHTHRFLAGLPAAQLREELDSSHAILAEQLGAAPRQMSFPGGRADADALVRARQAGFELLHGSRPGALRAGGPTPSALLPRLAMRPGLSAGRFTALAQARSGPLLRARAVDAAKALARAVLGHERYHRLYTRLRA